MSKVFEIWTVTYNVCIILFATTQLSANGGWGIPFQQGKGWHQTSDRGVIRGETFTLVNLTLKCTAGLNVVDV